MGDDIVPQAISPDSNWLLVDHLIQINLSTGEMRWQHVGIKGDLTDACYSSNGAWLAAVLDSANIVIYDAATGERVAFFAHNLNTVSSLSFSPDSEQLLVSGYSYDPNGSYSDGNYGYSGGATNKNLSFRLFFCATVVAAV